MLSAWRPVGSRIAVGPRGFSSPRGAAFPGRHNQEQQHATDSNQQAAHDEFHVRLLSPSNGLFCFISADVLHSPEYSNSRAILIPRGASSLAEEKSAGILEEGYVVWALRDRAGMLDRES